MARDKITEYDSTASNNTVCGDVNIAENSALPSDMNNFAREIMSHLKEGLGSGTPLYVDQTNNRLGINTSSPSVDLEISGGLSVDGGTIKLDGNYPTGSNNVALGDQALDDGSLSGGFNVAIGALALTSNTSGERNSALGMQALRYNTTGNYNTAVGQNALVSNTTASDNTALGYNALGANTTGDRNVAVGSGALDNNTVGDRSVAVGYHALTTQNPASDTDMYNTAVGHSTLAATTTGTTNTAIGGLALTANTTGTQNTAVGVTAGTTLTTGTHNTFIGKDAGQLATTGGYNTFVGNDGGASVTTGTKNTIIGRYNGNQGGLDIRTSSNNIVLSDGDGNPRGYYESGWTFITDSGAEWTAEIQNTSTSAPYGVYIRYPSATPNGVSNEFLYCGDGSAQRAVIRSNGGLANYQANNVNLSDERMKTEINPLSSYWDKIKSLEIVTFKYTDQTNEESNIGVIAQQVESVAPEFVNNDGMGETPEDGVPLKTVYTTDMYHASIKALQEAMERIETLEQKVATLEGA